ncbi:putative DNA topoisomerase 2 [Mollisia scopiformis]|uniref:DNA topoisomerase 2 n=1 Tax=Mollisia scopiformis TaxID=149040 RepID=A0A194XA08_MOLSC|nr:putative DNA topoisomerase 2 [Mollisia scopiformis]KUJ17005.1 putative DNA topoisomerase 2 [Mollisia scopiformis]
MEDSLLDESSAFDVQSDSDVFSPAAAPKTKAKPGPKKGAAPKAPKATTKAAPKKMVQTTLKAASKKRPKPESDDEDQPSDVDSMQDASLLSNTPPSAKKQKKAPAAKKSGGKPLQDIANESMNLDDAPASKPMKKKDATEQYQKLTQLEHIIKRPDTYIGSTERTTEKMWVFNSETSQMESRPVSFIPGLYKIFDEILVNAADNKQRDPSMKQIKVVVDREKGEISIENDGAGIPIEIHKKEKIYIPEMIFGHLLTGSNYDDDEAKTTGGRNGYGAKLCNVFSTEFTLETQDSNTGKRYKQTWTDNMTNMGKAKISSSKSSDFTRVTFTPDYRKFKMQGIDDDFEALVKRRVYDMAGTVKGVKVSLNGTLIKLDFKKYIEMYAKAIQKERGAEEGAEGPPSASVIIEDPKAHDHKWEIGFAVSDGSFQQVSFVNSIATTSGGTHVNYIADQICDKLLEVVKKKNTKGAALKSNQIRNHIFLFVNCLIVNPAFTSQTKEQLTTKVKQFGSKCALTEEFLKKIGKTDAVQNILSFAQAKADQMLTKSDGNKRSRMNNPKLVDANLAGTKHGHECTLILTEGDSAKGLAVAGRAILDPDRIGVFPLRGKLLNVRDASVDQISKNAEIQNIKQFLGLKHKQVYHNTHGLRYGHLMIMADQDHDGSHIKGLLINFLQVQFPSLLKLPDFFQEFITPIIKVWKGPNPKKPIGQKAFFTMPQYEEWKEKHVNDKGWKHKYYKGLGTSLPEDAQVYFSNLDDHLREFEVMKPEEEELIDLAFSKKKADQRKAWLGNFLPGTYLDHSTKTLTYDNFVNKELILFSMADNLRSIPSVLDGFKPGQRKVMFACFKRNLVRDMKVVELAGYVGENTAYHHGEASMHMTIIGLAQNFVGSNNVNCLEPSGNFGSRLAGGSDAASPRYIFTRLSPFARRVFSPLDEPLYEHNVDDGKSIEPTVYCPVVPMILINGADGIGTGWSTTIPNYHPVDVVNNLKRRMGRLDGSGEEKPFETMMPWFKGWKGTPEVGGPMRYNFNGIIKESGDNEVEITELPIRLWTDDFKGKLEDIIKGEKAPSFIKDYKEYNDHNSVHFVIQMDPNHFKAAVSDGLHERFKLNKTVATSNLVAFDSRGQIRKYEIVEDILEEYYVYRLAMYTKRKTYWLAKLNTEFRKLKNQARFVMEIIENKLVVSKKKKPVLVAELRKRDYEAFPKIKDAQHAGETDDVVENEDEASVDEDSGARDFDYLLGLPIWSLTQERVDKLKAQMEGKKEEHDAMEKLSEKDLWCQDLDDFVHEWEVQLNEEADYQKSIRNTNRRTSKKIGAGKNANGRGRPAKAAADTEYNPKPLKANPNKGIVKVEQKTHQRFLSMFDQKPKPKPKPNTFGSDGTEEPEEASGLEDDDFSVLKASSAAPQISRDSSEQRALPNGRTKRAAAAAPKKWVIDDDEESEDDDDKLLGDVGAMVKGIGGGDNNETTAANGRVSLFAMSRPGSSHGRSTSNDLPKLKAKPSRTFDLSDDNDETNYEMLARSSPHKAAPAPKDNLDSFLSDDEDLVPIPKKAPVKAPVPKAAAKPAPKPKKAPAPKKTAESSQPKPTALSPAAKAYAAKQSKMKLTSKKMVISDDDEEEEDEIMEDSPPPKPAARGRGRPARAAAAAKPKQPVYIDSDDDEDEMDVDDNDESALVEDASEDDFDASE